MTVILSFMFSVLVTHILCRYWSSNKATHWYQKKRRLPIKVLNIIFTKRFSFFFLPAKQTPIYSLKTPIYPLKILKKNPTLILYQNPSLIGWKLNVALVNVLQGRRDIDEILKIGRLGSCIYLNYSVDINVTIFILC